jgi:hypothetical protein
MLTTMKRIKSLLTIFLSILCILSMTCMGKKSTYDGGENKGIKEPKVLKSGVVFEKRLGGHDIDNGNDIIMTEDGGVLIAGYTFSKGAGKADAYLVKCNSGGDIEWDKTYGWGENDQVFSVTRTHDGGYIAAGVTESYSAGRRDVYVIKVDNNGNKEWEKIFGGEKEDEANCVIQTEDGGYMIAGMTFSSGVGGGDVYLLKLNRNSELEWEKTYGGKAKDFANHIEQTDDGGYIVVGYGGEKRDIYVLSLDGKGNVRWEKMFGGENFDVGNYIISTNDGGYIIAAITQPKKNGVTEVYIIKLKNNGMKQWERKIGGEDHCGSRAVKQLENGGYIVVGTTKNNENHIDNVFLMELDSEGNTRWMETFGGRNIAYGNGVVVPRPGRYVFTGYIYTVKSKEEADCNIYFVCYERK